MKKDIDVVIMWVDGADREWRIERQKYSHDEASTDTAAERYRDWDNLQYIFRGIEQFMPWVRKIHFVTWGHVPVWMNLKSEKLNIVKHEDFIPKKYLPVFSSHPIELNLHRIKGLSDKFILFNDDTFVVRPTKRDLFFSERGLPREQAGLITVNSNKFGDVMPHITINNNALINMAFSPKDLSVKVWLKQFSPRNGVGSLVRNLLLLPFSLKSIQSPDTPHMPSPLLKSTVEDVWNKFPDFLNKVSLTKFRSMSDINQYVFKQWQVLSGNYEPLNIKKYSVYVGVFPKDFKKLEKAIKRKDCKLICINDGYVEGDFEQTKQVVNERLRKILPNKSSFEVAT